MRSSNSFVVNPKKMPERERITLAKEVYQQAHSKIFDGASFEEFYHTVFTPSTVCTKVKIFTDQQQIIGYCSFQVYAVKHAEKTVHVVMSEMGMIKFTQHPSYFIMREVSKFQLLHQDKPTFILDTLISPFIYRKCCKKVYEIYPKRNVDTPTQIMSLIKSIGANFNWNVKLEKNAVIRSLKWKVRKDYIATHPERNLIDPNVEFYHAHVPDYDAGKGLVVVIPVSTLNIAMSVTKIFLGYTNYALTSYIAVRKKHLSRFAQDFGYKARELYKKYATSGGVKV